MDPSSQIYSILVSDLASASFIVPTIVMLLLLACSALVSGSEVAFFSLGPSDLARLREDEQPSAKRILTMLEHPDIEKGPRHLLATILVLNNFINIIIILLSTVVVEQLFPSGQHAEWLSILVNVAGITFLIVLFGEVIPKVYATNYRVELARFMSLPLQYSQRIFYIFWKPLVLMGGFIESRFRNNTSSNISIAELEHALQLTDSDERSDEEKKILEGIVSFGLKDVKQIMTPRTDVTAFDLDTPWQELFEEVMESGFSRLPVYKESIDEIVGVLYIKDLLPHFDEDDVQWNSLLRSPFFVPENKKIDDLLREFQEKKIHLAVVVDEYGGTSGIITLEDVIEEIVGDITDEFDEDDLHYSRLDDHNFVFDGKTSLIDVYRILDIDGSDFEAAKGDSDTLAGFIVEQAGKIPLKGERFTFGAFNFTIEASDRRRVKQVKVNVDESKREPIDPE